MEKTNVMRILDQKKIKYNEYFYGDTNAISGVEVAKVLNEDANKVFKTLVTIAKSKQNYIFMIPVEKELDLKKCAESVNEKNIEKLLTRCDRTSFLICKNNHTWFCTIRFFYIFGFTKIYRNIRRISSFTMICCYLSTFY